MRTARLAGALAALWPLLLPAALHAAPNDYIRYATVEEGEREIDLKWGIEKERNHQSANATAIGLGWGVNSWWFTEVYGKWHRDPGERSGFDAWEWENRFQLTTTGKYPLDVGVFLEVERPKDRAEGYEVTWGPLFQAEWDRLQGNFNVFIQKHVRATQSFDTELKYQAQLKYRVDRGLDWGAQAFGSLGRWDHWLPSSQQEHRMGPAIFGKVKAGATHAIVYNAALLLGVTSASPRAGVRVQAEYEF